MTDLSRKLLGLADQLDRVGSKDPVRPFTPLTRQDATTIRHGAHVIQKLCAEVSRLGTLLEIANANAARKTG